MGSLTLRKVTKSFGKIDVIKGVDLEVNDGEFFVFVGPSGCGKSTLLRIIAGLEDATSGDILIDGGKVNLTPPSKREHRDGLPVLRALSAPDRARQYGPRPEAGRRGCRDRARAGGGGLDHALARAAARPPPGGALGRPAPAGRHRPGHRAHAQALPLRRAAVQPRRGAARAHPNRDRPAAPAN